MVPNPEIGRLPEELVESAMRHTRTPGVAVGLWHRSADGVIEELAGFGITHLDHALPVTPDTIFQLGSITKVMTATVAMRLAERGQLDLDLPIARYLPDLRLQDAAVQARVTLRHLFTHTAGWVGDDFEDTGRGDDALAAYVRRMVRLPQQTPLGAIWSYNNAGFCLAGRVIEAVTGRTYEAAMHELLFKPLGMNMSFFFAQDLMTHRHVVGHEILPSGIRVATPWALPRFAHPAGGVMSTVRDVLRFARLHLNEGRNDQGEPLLQPASVAAMQGPLVAAGSFAQAVGIAWLIDELAEAICLMHGGTTNGQVSQLTLIPAKDLAIVVLTNSNRGKPLTREVVEGCLRMRLGTVQPQLPLRVVPGAELQEYAGRYVAQLSEVEVFAAELGLLLRIRPLATTGEEYIEAEADAEVTSAAFIGDEMLLITDGQAKGTRCDFLRSDLGEVAWLRHGGRLHRRMPQRAG